MKDRIAAWLRKLFWKSVPDKNAVTTIADLIVNAGSWKPDTSHKGDFDLPVIEASCRYYEGGDPTGTGYSCYVKILMFLQGRHGDYITLFSQEVFAPNESRMRVVVEDLLRYELQKCIWANLAVYNVAPDEIQKNVESAERYRK